MSDLEAIVRALEERVGQLEDSQAVSRLVASYGPAVDGGNDTAAGDLWTESGVYDLGFREIHGSADVSAMVRGEHHQALIHAGAAHVLGVPIVRVDGDRAVATCYSNVFRYVDGAFEVWRTAANRWELERTADGWRATRRTTRLLDGNAESRALLHRAVESEPQPPTTRDPRAVADRYVAVATGDGKEALAELFAVDATFHAPNGRIYRGRDEIAGFYRTYLANLVPTFHIHRSATEGRNCWIELADGPTDNPILRASNHFTVDDDGFIERLVVFLRPPAPS